jgi:hypothetical protein
VGTKPAGKPAREEPDAAPRRRGWDRVFKVFGILLLLVSGASLILGLGLRPYGDAMYSSSGQQLREESAQSQALYDQRLHDQTLHYSERDLEKISDDAQKKCAPLEERENEGASIRNMGDGLIWYGWRGAIIALVLLIAARYAPRIDFSTRGRSC